MAVLGIVTGILGSLLLGLRGLLQAIFTLPFRLTFTTIWSLLILWLLFNAPAIYGDEAAKHTTILMLYMVALTFVFVQTGQRNPLIGISLAEFLVTFVIWLGVTVIALKAFAPFDPQPAVLSTRSVGILLTHALVVAIGEELLFRYGFPGLIQRAGVAPIVAQLVSAILFGLFHWTAYGGSPGSMIVAMILGALFGAITVRFRNGLIIAMAAHAAYNLTVLGFTP